jgi:hypothetical protein
MKVGLEKKYGKDNVVSAYVHKDENQPHMHFAFVPVVRDKKKNDLKVSAKECVTRNDLKNFHDKLSSHMKNIFGRDIGILNEATKEGNKSIQELKRESAINKLNNIREKTKTVIDNAQKELKDIDYKLQTSEIKYNTLNTKIDEMNKKSESTIMYPTWAKTKKNLLGKKYVTVPAEKWEARHISANELESIKKQRKILIDKINEIKNSDLYKNINKLTKEVSSLKKENKELEKANGKLERGLNQINNILEKNPKLKKEFLTIKKSMEKKDFGRGIER